jgi:amino acid adenylation domain-containing protein
MKHSYLLSHAIDAAAEQAPGDEGLRFRGQGLTWSDYARRVDALAVTLRQLGVRRGDRVGLFLGKSLDSGIGLYGVIKAGAAYVPIDPLAPAARVRFIIENCGIEHLVADRPRLAMLHELEAAGVVLRSVIGIAPGSLARSACIDWNEVRRQEGELADFSLMEDDLAYVMYTSGSTGVPKGIMHTHRSGLAFARWAAVQFEMRPGDRLTNHAPLHFDLSTMDYFSAPLAGTTTVIVPEEHLKMPASYAELLEKEEITLFYTVPFTLIQLVLRGAIERRTLRRLRWVIFGGEPMPPAHLRRLMSAWPHVRFCNLYGPAEVNGCTFYELPSAVLKDGPIPIGRLCPNMDSLVLAESDKPAEMGQPGELLIRSATMMAGYWNRPDLNARAFFYRQLVEGYQHCFYRTGDLVLQRDDGTFLFLGRKDRQVKTRGYRVELDEVESALALHEAVEEAAALALPDGEGSRQIAAMVTLRTRASATPPELLQHARSRLPWYAVPARLDIIEVFPRTTSGKIDRRALEAGLTGPAAALHADRHVAH